MRRFYWIGHIFDKILEGTQWLKGKACFMWNSPLPGPPLGISVAHLIPVPFLKCIRSLLFKYQGRYIGHLAFLYNLSAPLLLSHLLQAVFNTWYYWLLPFSQCMICLLMRMEEEMRRYRIAQCKAPLEGPGWARREGCHRMLVWFVIVFLHLDQFLYDIDRLHLWYIHHYFYFPLNFLGQIMLCIWDQTVGIIWWLFASFSALTIIQNSCSTQYRKSIFWPTSSPFVSCFQST